MPFKNANVERGLREDDPFQVGRADSDRATPLVEKGALLPWPSDPEVSWVYYECAVGTMLDSGLVVHNRLPQVDNAADSLGTQALDDPRDLAETGNGVNLSCRDQYADIVQRMGHARYWFRLWGQAMRVGLRIPIPKLVTIGGVAAIPYDRNPQWAYNAIAPGGNFGGVPLWIARWSLWYTTLVPTRGGSQNAIPAVDLAAHIRDTDKVPKEVQVPFSQVDDNAIPAKPNLKPIPGTTTGPAGKRPPLKGTSTGGG